METLERARYRILEFVYLHVGGNCSTPLAPMRIFDDLGYPADSGMQAIRFLVKEGFLDSTGSEYGQGICLTDKGIQYIQQNAWRRRSLRGEYTASSE